MNMPPCALPTPIICSGYNLALDIKKPYDTDHYIPREHLNIESIASHGILLLAHHQSYTIDTSNRINNQMSKLNRQLPPLPPRPRRINPNPNLLNPILLKHPGHLPKRRLLHPLH